MLASVSSSLSLSFSEPEFGCDLDLLTFFAMQHQQHSFQLEFMVFQFISYQSYYYFFADLRSLASHSSSLYCLGKSFNFITLCRTEKDREWELKVRNLNEIKNYGTMIVASLECGKNRKDPSENFRERERFQNHLQRSLFDLIKTTMQPKMHF